MPSRPVAQPSWDMPHGLEKQKPRVRLRAWGRAAQEGSVRSDNQISSSPCTAVLWLFAKSEPLY